MPQLLESDDIGADPSQLPRQPVDLYRELGFAPSVLVDVHRTARQIQVEEVDRGDAEALEIHACP